MQTINYKPGLEGVIAVETAISFLDSEKEKIVIRGQDLIELSNKKLSGCCLSTIGRKSSITC